MGKTNLVHRGPSHAAGLLKTTFVTADQTTALLQILDLALEDLDQVSGGIIGGHPDGPGTCMCKPTSPTCTSKPDLTPTCMSRPRMS